MSMIFGLFGGEKKRVADMIAAARAGETEKIKRLLAKGADINAPEPESGDTPLLAAIDNDQWAAAELLLKQKPDLNLEDKNGNSPLYLVVSKGDSALLMVNLLLEAGAKADHGPSKGGNAGATPLHIACATGANGCLESLLRYGASATKQLDNGATPMHSAAIGGDQKTILALSKAGGDLKALDNETKTPLHNCGIAGNAIVAATLIRLGAEIDPLDNEGCTPLMRAAMQDHAKVVKVLLDNGANPNCVVQTETTTLFPLYMAVQHGQEEIVNMLLEKGVDPDAKYNGVPSLVNVAKHLRHESMAKLLAAVIKRQRASAKEAQVFAKEADALWNKAILAISHRDQDSLRKLAETKHFSSLNPDARLLVACVLGDAELASAMLTAGADQNKEFTDVLDGITPLYAAVGFAKSVDTARLLLDKGADPNKTWSQGSTPIFETTTDQYLQLAKLLVDKGANVNVQLVNGMSPLMQAARNGAASSVDLLLDAGADINAIENENGLGAFGLALNRLHLTLAEHLFDRGAESNFGSIETLPLAIAEHASLAFVKALVSRGCNLLREDQRGRMAFMSARNPDPEVFDYMLNHGADPSEGNDFGYTPLILAALNNRPTLIRRYLQRGDDASVRDIDGETALSLVIEKAHHEAVEALREFHVEEKDYSGVGPERAMLQAASDGALGTILNLRDEGISINSEDDQGNSPLMLAAKTGHLGVVRSLYHLGADINHRNHSKETAIAIARASEFIKVVESLQEFGALDAKQGELGEFLVGLGGAHVWSLGSMMAGRMSHPYKDKPPYEDDETDSEAESDENVDGEEPDDGGDDTSEDDSVQASVGATLDLLGQFLASDQVKEQVSEAVLEQPAQKLDDWRSMHESSGLDDDEIVELNRILGVFGLGEEETEETVRTPLFEAVHAQDLGAVKKLIKGGTDVNEVDSEGNTVLIVAIVTGQEKLVDGLLKLGADSNKTRPDGVGPLFASALIGKDKIAQALLNAGAEVDARSSLKHNGIAAEGCTALYAAAFTGRISTCKALLGNGAQIDAANDIGYTPLMAAIEGGHEDVIDFLLKGGANVNPEVIARMHVEGLGGASPLHTATRKGNLAVIKKLLKHGVDVNRPSGNLWTPLKSAAQQGNLDIVKVLLDGGADPNIADNTNYTPLMNAVSGEHEDIVKLLLKFRADPNIQSGENPDDDDWEAGRTALMDAAVSGNLSIARELLKQGADPNLLNTSGRTALHSAVISGSADMVALLLKSGADGDVYGNEEEARSALDLALRKWANKDEDDREGGSSNVLELLLKKGIPSNRASLNEAALDLFAEGHIEVFDFLHKHEVTVDANQSWNGASALFFAAAVGFERIEAAKMLLKIGADANFKSRAGLSVLSLAVRNGATKFAQALLAAGANVMDRNSAGALAYDLAVLYDHHELAQILIGQMNRKVTEADQQDAEGCTALMRAVMSGDASAVSQLLDKGVDTSRRNLLGESPLSYAICHASTEIVHLLRNAGAERLKVGADTGEKPIVTAGKLGALGVILDFLDSGVEIDDSDSEGETALTSAVAHPGVVKALAKLGANLSHRNQGGKTAYMIAAGSNRTLMMRTLEAIGSPIDEPSEMDRLAQMQAMLNALQSKEPSDDSDDSDTGTNAEVESDADELLMASCMGDAVAVSIKIAAGVNVNHTNSEGRTALIMALAGQRRGEMSRRRERNFDQIIDSLLAAGADPNRGTLPPLIVAITTGRLHLVNALIRAGADINATAGPGVTLANSLLVALTWDEHGSHVDERISLAIIRAGVDLSFAGDDGSRAVHCAAKAGRPETLRAILDRAPESIDALDSEDSTPLMLAAANNRPEAIRVLLELQADREIRDAKGRTAAEIAVAEGHQEAAAALA